VSGLLVVDDEPNVVTVLSRALTARGFDVDIAFDGEQALLMAKARDYGLIVLDLRMPALDGWEVLRAIIADRPEQQVLIVSALSDIGEKVRCLELGAADFLAKPFALAEFIARVRARMRASGPRGRFLTAGPVRLDVQRRVATVRDRDVTLSPREFVLLHHLMRKAGDVCTREELLATEWGYTFDTDSNVVDVYVIETIRRVGYRFDDAA
jgi:DNA-binding response OmpR family regulator